MQVIFLFLISEGGALLKFIIEVNRSVEERRRKISGIFYLFIPSTDYLGFFQVCS